MILPAPSGLLGALEWDVRHETEDKVKRWVSEPVEIPSGRKMRGHVWGDTEEAGCYWAEICHASNGRVLGMISAGGQGLGPRFYHESLARTAVEVVLGCLASGVPEEKLRLKGCDSNMKKSNFALEAAQRFMRSRSRYES